MYCIYTLPGGARGFLALPELGGAGGGTEEERTGAAIDEPLIEQEKGRRTERGRKEGGRERKFQKVHTCVHIHVFVPCSVVTIT